MNVTSSTTVHELVKAYPYMLDWLIRRDDHFENLRNPVMFETMARVATLEKVADSHGLDLDQLLDEIRTEIARTQIVAEEKFEIAESLMTPEQLAAAAARQASLKAIICKLHDGVPVDEVKAEFDELITDVDSAEIARMEQALIAEGMPIEDVQRLCDVHVTVFKSSLEAKPSASVGTSHPLDAYQRENEVVTRLTGELRAALTVMAATGCASGETDALDAVGDQLASLAQVEIHYVRKENQLFPVLEKHEVSGPTKVMWGLDDDIRARIKSARALVAAGDCAKIAAVLPELLTMVDDMVYKEEKILFPTSLQIITDAEWAAMAAGDAEIGYAWVEGPAGSAGREAAVAATPTADEAAAAAGGEVPLPLPTGALTLSQLDVMLRVLPFDLSFVDENDRVRFYSEGQRVFPRSPGAIGREVRNCHPPRSLDKVEQILAEFHAGTKDIAEFWIEMPAAFERRDASAPNAATEAAESASGKFIHIQYFAMRDADDTYRGCLEIVQDATHVRALEGQRRIVDW